MTTSEALKLIRKASAVYVRVITSETPNGHGISDRYFRISKAHALQTIRGVSSDEEIGIRCRLLNPEHGWEPDSVLIG